VNNIYNVGASGLALLKVHMQSLRFTFPDHCIQNLFRIVSNLSGESVTSVVWYHLHLSGC